MTNLIILDEKADSVQYLCNKDENLKKVISMVGPISYIPHESGYSFLVSQIINQVLSNKTASIIFGRLQELCHGNISPEIISGLSDEQLLTTKTARRKIGYIRALTNAVRSGALDFSRFPELSDSEIIQELTAVHGIGNWSAKMYLIFVLNREDILPFEDIAFIQAYRWLYDTKDVSPDAVKKRCQEWKPYSSIAARYMYRALDMGLTKQDFYLYK